MTLKKQCLPDTIGLIHIWTHRVCGRMHRAYISSSQTGSQLWEEEIVLPTPNHETIAPNHETIAIDTCWQQENQFSLIEYQPHSRAGSIIRMSWPTENKQWYFCRLLASFCFVLEYFCLTGLLLACFDFHFCGDCFLVLLVLKDKEQNYVGRKVKRIWEVLGKGITYQQNILYEKINYKIFS